MIANVFVKQKIRNGHSFDYEIGVNTPKMLSLVEVPIRNKKAIGLVVGIKDKSEYATKPISRLLTLGSAFTDTQIELASVLAKNFISSIQETVFSFIPNLNIGDYKIIRSTNPPSKKGGEGKTSLVIGGILERIIFALRKTGEQSLFVFPTIEQVEYAKKLFKKLTGEVEIDSWHSQIKSSDKANLWQKLINRRGGIVVSTRHGLFLPFTHLKTIYIDDPTNFAYHEDQAPYYNAYKVSRLVSKLYGANLIIGEAIPDLLSFTALERKDIKFFSIKTKLNISFKPRWDEELKNEDFIKFMRHMISRDKKIAVVGPWKRQLKYLCMDCKHVLNCESCSEEYFVAGYCIKCKNKVDVATCPLCKSTKIKLVNFSFEFIRNDLKKIFSQPEMEKISIIAINQLDFIPPHFSLVLIPYFDQIKDFPYLNYREKLFRAIRSLGSTGARDIIFFGENLKDNKFAVQIADGNWRSFFQDELRERKKSKLPPLRQAVLLVVNSKSLKRNSQVFAKVTQGFKNKFEFTPIDDEAGKVVRSKYLTLIEYKDFDEFAKIASRVSFPEAHFEVDPVEFS